MKNFKKLTTLALALAMLAGCGAKNPVDTPATETPAAETPAVEEVDITAEKTEFYTNYPDELFDAFSAAKLSVTDETGSTITTCDTDEYSMFSVDVDNRHIEVYTFADKEYVLYSEGEETLLMGWYPLEYDESAEPAIEEVEDEIEEASEDIVEITEEGEEVEDLPALVYVSTENGLDYCIADNGEAEIVEVFCESDGDHRIVKMITNGMLITASYEEVGIPTELLESEEISEDEAGMLILDMLFAGYDLYEDEEAEEPAE